MIEAVEIQKGVKMLIADMFSGELTPPKIDSAGTMDGFDAFWKVWPSGTRKVAKIQCQQKWAKLELASQVEHICKHVAWMKTQEDWQKQNGAFIPMPATYLNQQRWIDWEPPVRLAIDPAEQTRIMLAERDKKAAPMPQDVRERLNALRRASA